MQTSRGTAVWQPAHARAHARTDTRTRTRAQTRACAHARAHACAHTNTWVRTHAHTHIFLSVVHCHRLYYAKKLSFCTKYANSVPARSQKNWASGELLTVCGYLRNITVWLQFLPLINSVEQRVHEWIERSSTSSLPEFHAMNSKGCFLLYSLQGSPRPRGSSRIAESPRRSFEPSRRSARRCSAMFGAIFTILTHPAPTDPCAPKGLSVDDGGWHLRTLPRCANRSVAHVHARFAFRREFGPYSGRLGRLAGWVHWIAVAKSFFGTETACWRAYIRIRTATHAFGDGCVCKIRANSVQLCHLSVALHSHPANQDHLNCMHTYVL